MEAVAVSLHPFSNDDPSSNTANICIIKLPCYKIRIGPHLKVFCPGRVS